ncbi:hypothetical protein ABZ348_15780 [Streptomyces sp. NPDC005963]|uniref:hypothetical protein n=1 Tax=Streptomyces sp. NPDC005963 TaxID=3156721 RepID=UPI0033F10BA2
MRRTPLQRLRCARLADSAAGIPDGSSDAGRAGVVLYATGQPSGLAGLRLYARARKWPVVAEVVDPAPGGGLWSSTLHLIRSQRVAGVLLDGPLVDTAWLEDASAFAVRPAVGTGMS